MGRFLRLASAIFLIPCLAFSTTGAIPNAQGFVAAAQQCSLVKGTTVFTGSEIETASQGHASIYMTAVAAKLFLVSDTSIKFAGTADEPVVHLQRGTVGFIVDSGANLRVLAAGAAVTSASGRPAKGEIRLIAKDQLSVAAITEPLTVSAGPEVVIVPTGSVYAMRIETQERQDPAGVGAPEAKRRRTIFILAGALAATLTGIGIWLDNRAGGGSVVSPAIP